MNDRAAPERGDDRARNKRGPEGSQRTESPPRREGAVSRAKPQNEGPKKSEGRHRSKAKLDADAQGAALAFGGDEAQGPQRPDTSESARVPDREDDDDVFPLGGRSADGRRKSAEFEAALPRAMETEDDALPNEAAAATSLVAPLAQAPVLLPSTTAPLIFAAGGGVSAARALPPVLSEEVIVDMFLASKTEEAAAALLAAVTVPSEDDAVGRTMYATVLQLVTTTVAGTLRYDKGPINLKAILQNAGLTDKVHGLDKGNKALVGRFMDPAVYAKKERAATRNKRRFNPPLDFPTWLRAALVRLVEMLASRSADVVAEREEADAEAKWADRVAAAKASRAALMELKPADYETKVLESLERSAAELNASGRTFTVPLGALVAEAFAYFPYGRWSAPVSVRDQCFADFERKLREYAARKPAAEELASLLNALGTKQVASMDDSEATQLRVHAAQLAAVANTAVVGERPSRLVPEWDDAGRLRSRDERAAEELAQRSAMGCDLGTLHPRHNAAVAASIGESGELQRRTLEKGRKAEHQMFYDARDVPKPRSPEEMVRNYRHSTGWNGKEWVEGAGGGEASRARAAAQRAGAPAEESDEDFDPGL